MKKIILFAIYISSFQSFSQTTTKDKIEIEIKKSKIVNNVSVFGIRQLKVTSDKLQKVMIKTKIKSLGVKRTNLSAFSLLDTVNKIRYRLADYKGYTAFIGEPELIPYRKTEFFDKNGKSVNYEPSYDVTVKDYFYDYNIEGYTNFEIPINFGTTKNPQLSILYFGTTYYKNFTAELFFALLIENTNLDYQLYYKDEKIADIKF